MYIHLIGLIITLLLSKWALVYQNSTDKNESIQFKKIIILLSIIPFSFISGVRYYVGTDWKMYRNVFLQIKNGRQFSSLYFERGYLLLNKIVGFFSGNYSVFFTVIAFLTTTFWFIAIYYLSDNQRASIFLWVLSQFYFFSFNGMRQALAISLFYFGLLFLQKKKYVLYMIVIAGALTIHRSAIIMVPLLFFGNIKMKFSRYVEVLLGAFILGRFSIQIVNRYSFFEKYRMYLKVKNDFSVSDFIILLFVWFFALAVKKRADANGNEKFNLFYNILFYSLVLCTLTAYVPYMYRFLLYYKYITVLLIPEICKEYKYNRTSITVKVVTYTLYGIQILYYALIMHYNEYTHYAWVLGRNV